LPELRKLVPAYKSDKKRQNSTKQATP